MQAPTNLCCMLRSHARPSPLVNSRPSQGEGKVLHGVRCVVRRVGGLVDSHLPLTLTAAGASSRSSELAVPAASPVKHVFRRRPQAPRPRNTIA